MQFEIFGLSKQTLDLFVNVNNFFIMGFGKQIKRLRLKSKVSAQMLGTVRPGTGGARCAKNRRGFRPYYGGNNEVD
jgi:hypothetical protein